MKSSTKPRNGHGSLYKEVRFSPTATPIRRTQSVPNAYAVAHATQLLSQATTVPKGGDSATLSASYLQQAQGLLDRQRMMVETERLLFAEERELWVHERQILLARIAELESLLKNTRHGHTDISPPPTSTSTTSTSQPNTGASTQKRSITFQLPFKPPHSSSHDQPSQNNATTSNVQIWEGSSPGHRPTRVFPDAENNNLAHHQHPPSITEQGVCDAGLSVSALSLDRALSPKSRAADTTTHPSMSVPIEKLDSKLDGITLKSSALHPEIVARVMTPPSPASRETSPCSSSHRAASDRRCSLKLKLADLGPPEKNLVKDAGHTPMVFIDRDGDEEAEHLRELAKEESEEPSQEQSPSTQSSSFNSPSPLAPAAPRQPAENSDTYFPDLPDDPALKGPLSLLNEEEHDSNFLRELDQKLLGEARQVLGAPPREDDPATQGEEDQAQAQAQEQDPAIKFKKTTNFGTAFGTELR